MPLSPSRSALGLALLLASLASACQNPELVGAKKRLPTEGPAVEASATPAKPLPSATPSSVVPSAPPSLNALGALSPLPQGRALTGRVKVDAAYALAQGVAMASGAQSISAEGGPLPKQGEGLAVGGAESILGVAAGSLLSNHGSGVIANQGGAIISDHGAGMRLLLQSEALPVGEERAAGGVLVGLVDLGAGKLLPVGLGPKGQAVFAVATDAEGAFTVHAPPAAAGSVALVAAFPQAGSDRRLALESMVGAEAQSVSLDDDQALVTRYLRRSLSARFLELFQAAVAFDPGLEGSDAGIKAFYDPKDAKDELAARAGALILAQRLKKAQLSEGDLPDAASRVAQAFMGALDLPALTLGSPVLGQGTALGALGEAVRRAREAAKLSSQGPGALAALAAKPELVASGVTVRRPADLIEAMVERYLTVQSIYKNAPLDRAMVALGMSEADAKVVTDAFTAGAQAVENRASKVIDEAGVADKVFAAIDKPNP